MNYKIPLFNLNFDEKEANAAAETIKGGWISAGPKCSELETMFADMIGTKYAVSVTNCTAALFLCCLVCGIGPGDEVIVPALTFSASANCIRYTGATPVFADIVGTDHINIDPDDIKKKITSKTKAVVVVDMAGFPAKMNEIMDIAEKYNLKIIEDSCHGPLSEYHGRKIGSFGDCSAFSFFSNKNISTGEGGMFVTNSKLFAERARLLRSHGMTTMSYQRASGHATSYDVIELGYNFRFDDIRASIAIEQLKKLPSDLEKRAIVRKRYIERFSQVDSVAIPFSDCNEFVSNYIMPTVLLIGTVEDRERVRNRLHEVGIQTSVHYPAIHRFSIYKDYYTSLPNTEFVTDHEITLPMYAGLSLDQIDYIVDEYIKAINTI